MFINESGDLSGRKLKIIINTAHLLIISAFILKQRGVNGDVIQVFLRLGR